MIKSVRSAVKLSRSSPRERNDSGYESDEDNENYLEQIITHHQPEQQLHVYPVLHGSRSPHLERRGTTIDDLISPRNSRHLSRSNLPRRYVQRSVSMSGQRSRRQSSVGNSQSLKSILQRRSTLFDSSIGNLIHLSGTPRLNSDDTYVSARFRNENTSKFVIGTLWNTFALVNNLFLQRPRKRRDAIPGDDIHAEELVHLEQLYSLAEQDRENDLHSTIRDAFLKPETNNLQSIIFDILSSNKKEPSCTCYGNHHVPSCIYYDHSLPYIKRYLDNTSELQKIVYDIQKSNKPKFQDASTQSYIDKPVRTFIHSKSMANAATQSTLGEVFSHAATQYSPREISTQFNPNDRNYINIFPPMKANDYINVNAATQVTPIENENMSTQYTLEKSSPKKPNSPKKMDNEAIYNQRTSMMNELKQVISSTNFKPNITNEENKPQHNHTVRSLVSIFETTQPLIGMKMNLPVRQKSIIESPQMNIPTEEIQSPISQDTVEQYANEVASSIVDNAVLTATTTTVYHNEQLHRRFSFYKNGGAHGKSLLFQSNTFVPASDVPIRELDQNSRGIFLSRIVDKIFI